MYGLYYAYERALLSLPLLSVHAAASINDLAAQVNLTQTYRNDASFPIEAKYSFPVPARAAVSSFTMIKQDGTRVVGSVLEKFEAKQTYDAAVSKGQQASLMEQQTPDVFRVAVGNIPSNEQVQIELVYSTEVAEDEESDSVRFHLPVHIGARYGQAPADFVPAPSSSPFLTISTTVEALAPISNIGSPSHAIRTELGPDPTLRNFKDLPSSHYARVSLSSDTALDKDFVLTFKSTGLDSPRCVAELHPTNDTTALALSLVPRFTLPDLARQEFILLVDRSGSMAGPRIVAARKALIVLLSSLPYKDTLFQIVSFGSRTTSLWPAGSRAYNKDTLAEATRHVDWMQADYGGTEIRAALEHAFAKRASDGPTSVLVLTDGDAWDLEGVFESVKRAVEDAKEGAPLRVSVLGIGDSVSTAMCEGIARLGQGTFMLVDEREASFSGKVARLLKAARTPVISNITVDWGRPLVEAEAAEGVRAQNDSANARVEEGAEAPQNKTLNVFDVNVDPTLLDKTAPPPAPPVILSPPPPVQQSPFKIRNLFPGSRLNFYAILQGQTIPETVTLRGVAPDGAVVELPVPVTLSRLPHAPGSPPALHALAARRLIQDLEDGQHAFGEGDVGADPDLLERTLRAQIVRLGTTYQITSTHTSFVAVDEAQVRTP
ncbi:von Willebrand factor type A domain-containing protein, partial [Mycena sanguinolenta]